DLLLANAKVVNVFTGEVESGNVAICGDRIAGVGDYQQAKQVLDLGGKYLAPGLINGHIHPESSMLDITQYARAVVPRGTLAIVTDLHEIANVSGLDGIRYVLNCARRLPLEFFLMAPSCVPATHLETSGARLGPEDIRQILRWKGVIGLGEVMNFPGVLSGDVGVLSKIDLIEIHEAFAAQALANFRELGITEKDYDKVNVNGSCVSIGHPLGATGARILTTLLYEMQRRNARYGLEAICGGGGMGVCGILEKGVI
ncbi:unnamed protein product, partial [marine sediment metagenome]